MKITFLGTGTSTGVPVVGCPCEVCHSTDVHDKRLRCSALVETEYTRILIDCGPDFREQMLRLNRFDKIDGVLITHEHYDHVGGLDDLRPFTWLFGDTTLYADAYCARHLRARIPYCFLDKKYPGIPQIRLQTVVPHQSFSIGDVEITPIKIEHGLISILGFRIGNMAYITDMKSIEDEELNYLRDLDLLVVSGLRFKPHQSHQTIDEAIAFFKRTGAREGRIIHMGHQAGFHKDSPQRLCPHVKYAYDGEVIDL